MPKVGKEITVENGSLRALRFKDLRGIQYRHFDIRMICQCIAFSTFHSSPAQSLIVDFFPGMIGSAFVRRRELHGFPILPKVAA
ncbi:MAG TPA: hypothetical protein VK709_03850 [Candidatus Saccharimonadales bacterium]|jgi:hypothetical protein|nr:hypothetical protein [Candidatus Saccharimonadales bacterium]